jgi:hypothetical protein
MLSELYNKIGGAAQKITEPLSNVFRSKPIVYDREEYLKSQGVKAPVAPVKYSLKDREAEFDDNDFEKIRPLLYGEIGNRDFSKKAMEADVIFNTAINRQREYRKKGKNMTIADIVAMPNQYQAYGGDQYKNYYNPKNPLEVAKKKEIDSIVDAIAEKIKKGQYVDNTEGAFYYVHEDDGRIKYDNLKKLYK